MASMQSPFISIALSRLRGGVSMCCWVVTAALVTQLMVFGFAAFMDVRHVTLEEQVTPATIVSAESRPLEPVSAAPKSDPSTAVNPNVVVTKYDRVMSQASTIALSAGTIAMVLVIPMLMVAVMLSASSATPGVEKVVSAFLWSLAVTLLVLPLGSWLGMPWSYGGLMPYEHMTQHVDKQMVDGHWGGVTFHARFVVLPLACIVGVGIVGFRFSAGVIAGIIPREDMRLDPALEREASNIKASSLLGGRNAAALRNLQAPTAPLAAPSPAPAAPQPAAAAEKGILQMSAGDAPKRLI